MFLKTAFELESNTFSCMLFDSDIEKKRHKRPCSKLLLTSGICKKTMASTKPRLRRTQSFNKIQDISSETKSEVTRPHGKS